MAISLLIVRKIVDYHPKDGKIILKDAANRKELKNSCVLYKTLKVVKKVIFVFLIN